MKWKTKEEPNIGDKRHRIKFAMTPRPCEDGITRWLCRVHVEERFTDSKWSPPSWKEIRVCATECDCCNPLLWII